MFLAAIFMAIPQLNPMQAFVAQPQPGFAWHHVAAGGHEEVSLISQEWKGITWKHDVVLQRPTMRPREELTAFLVVTGDRVDSVDLPFGEKLAKKSGLPVITLFNVPNQPLFDRREDALIAYTFEQFLETGERSWPLLFPMVNSVKRAMDAAEKEWGFKKFIVTGSSKRGWTTWLTGALDDPRVVAIAPVAFDNLNFGAQLKHQMETWGHLSEMLKDYVSEGLTGQAESKEGQELIRLTDPYNYLSDVRVPVLIVRGANDPYWATDAMNIYWDAIKGPKELLVLPNEGHDFKDDRPYIGALANLSRHYSESSYWESIWREMTDAYGNRALHGGLSYGSAMNVSAVELWGAASNTPDLRNAAWSAVRRPAAKKNHYLGFTPDPLPDKYFAHFYMFTRKDGSKFTTTVQVVPRSQPLRPN